MDDERPPICPVCGVTMLPASLGAAEPDAATDGGSDWVCVECEETGDADAS